MNIKYPHFGRIDQLYPNPHIVLGHDIWWTLKLDGSNCGIYFDDNGEIKVRSRNQDVAEFYQKVENVPAYEKVVDFMTFRRDEYGSDFVVFAELLNKGRSPTGIKVHDKDEIVIFDMYNGKTEKYVHYPQLSLFCGAFDIPLTPLVGKCNVTTLPELLEFRDQMLEASKGEEGVVGKVYNKVYDSQDENFLFIKEKHHMPKLSKLPHNRSENRKIELPQLDAGEVCKCVAKVFDHMSLSNFLQTKYAMPAIAKEVSIECKQQNCGNYMNLYDFYTRKLNELVE